VSIGSWAAVELRAMDGTGDGAATAIAAVKPCAFSAPLRGFGA
jgi:hypothetical protein